MRMTRIALALLAAMYAAPSVAQTAVFPQTLPANSVVGRLGGTLPGPAQAIPFATLTGKMFAGASAQTGYLFTWGATSPIWAPSDSGPNVYAMGAVGNGIADDTVALTKAFASAALVAGQVALPCGTFLISGSGSAIFTLTTPIRIVGSGVCTTLLIKSTVPNTTDVFHAVANAAVPSGLAFQNFEVLNQGTGARHVFNLDTTGSATAYFSQPVISGITQANALNGFSVFINNNTSNLQGGTVRPYIGPNNLFKNPIQIVYGGDSIVVANNTIVSSTVAIYASLIAGAGNLQVTGNNVGSAAGCIVIDSGVMPVIVNNECEQSGTNTEVNNAVVDLNGGIATIDGALISGNTISVIAGSGTGNPIPLRIGAVGAASAQSGAAIIGNRFGVLTSYAPLVITASAYLTIVGPGNTCPICSGGVLLVSDAGTFTNRSAAIGTTAATFGPLYFAGGDGLAATAAMTNGQLLVGQTGAAPLPKTVGTDATLAASGALTLATVNGNVGSFGSATQCTSFTTNAKGLITAASAVTCTPAASSLTGTLQAAQEPAHTGDVTNTAGSLAMTLAAGNAGNLNSGTLLAARMPALTGDCTTSAGAVATTCTKINGVDQTTAWASYTPTLSCGSGTLTTSSATGAFKQIGKTTFVRFVATITTNGTCATSLIVTLPAAPVTSQEMMIGVRDVLNGQFGAGRINSAVGTSATITRYDGAYLPVSGSTIVGTGVYEAN